MKITFLIIMEKRKKKDIALANKIVDLVFKLPGDVHYELVSNRAQVLAWSKFSH